MSIMHFDTTSSSRPVIITLDDITASASAVTPSNAEATIRVRTFGDVTRRINGSTSVMYDWIDPKTFAPGDYEMSRGASAPFDLDTEEGAGYGPLAGDWVKIDTGGVFWGFQTNGVSSYTATFPVYIRENTGTPGPTLDTATWTISITETASSGGGGGGGCFTSNMRVLMADGTEKRIADILVGEMVMSLNTETNKLISVRVQDVMVPRICDIYKIKFSNGKTIETTIEHPFATADGRWANINPEATHDGRKIEVGSPMRQLHEGMLIRGAEGDVRIAKIIDTGRKETVYNLTNVGPYHNFFVEGVCVHNKVDEGDLVLR